MLVKYRNIEVGLTALLGASNEAGDKDSYITRAQEDAQDGDMKADERIDHPSLISSASFPSA